MKLSKLAAITFQILITGSVFLLFTGTFVPAPAGEITKPDEALKARLLSSIGDRLKVAEQRTSAKFKRLFPGVTIYEVWVQEGETGHLGLPGFHPVAFEKRGSRKVEVFPSESAANAAIVNKSGRKLKTVPQIEEVFGALLPKLEEVKKAGVNTYKLYDGKSFGKRSGYLLRLKPDGSVVSMERHRKLDEIE